MKVYLVSGAIVTMLFFAILQSCSKSDAPKKLDVDQGFDKKAMLITIADQIIIPGYNNFQQKVNAFKTSADAFLANRNKSTQAGVLDAYKQMHLQYENIEVFGNIGPAYTLSFEAYVNYFGGLASMDPNLTGYTTNVAAIENNISSSVYNLNAFTINSFYSQGFGAIGYLFFSPDAINKFNTNTQKRIKYASDIVNRIKTLTDSIVQGWPTYRNKFIENTKSDVGSPIGNLVNQMSYVMDIIKGPRIGWPFGKQSNGQIFPNKVEGYYAGNSVSLATTSLKNLKKVFTANNSGKGFSDYLNALGKKDLNNQVLAQFDIAIAKLSLIPDPLSTSLSTNATEINTAYREVQKLLTLIKTDVASALSVQINFMDNDGD